MFLQKFGNANEINGPKVKSDRLLGLGQYETSFRENGVDAEVLSDLTDADLEKLGVLLGHRKRLLKAIAGLKGSAAEPVPGRPPASALRSNGRGASEPRASR